MANPNLLESIGTALRGAGAVFSPDVYQAQNREREQFEQIKAQREQMLQEMSVRAVENGSLPPEKFQILAQKRGWNLPPVGPTATTAKTQADLQLQQQTDVLRSQIDSQIESKYQPPLPATLEGEAIAIPGGERAPAIVPESPTGFAERETERAMAYMRSGNSKLVEEGRKIAADLRAEERAGKQAETTLAKLIRERDALPPNSPYRATYDAAIAAEQTKGEGAGTQYERALRTLQQLQLQLESGTALTREQEFQAQSARAILQQQRMAIDPVTNQPYFIQPLTVPPSITVGGGGSPARQSGVLPSLESGRKPLDAGTEKEFQAMGDGRAQMTMLIAGLKPGYGGFVSETLGQGAIEGGRRGLLPQYKDMAQWWQGYEQWITDVRAAKFGMTLTGYELQQFNKYRVKPSDADISIRENLSRQLSIVDRAIERRLGSVRKSGQNVEQAEELLGPRTAPITQEQTPTGTQLEWTSEDEAKIKEVEKELERLRNGR